MLNKLFNFVRMAGRYQVKESHKKDLQIAYKDKNLYSIVSKADLKISEMFENFARKEFKNLNYFIVDEESFAKYGCSIFSKIEKCEYLFVIDPLDGTLQYSQGIPIYGISIGVFKNKRPYMGVMYLPFLKELVYSTENKQAYWIKNAFGFRAQKISLNQKIDLSSSLIVDLQQHFELDKSKNTKGYLFVDYLCSVFSYVLLATARVRSGMFKDWLWDMAGAWAVFDAIGYGIYDVKGKKYLNSLDLADFTDDLKFKNAHIIGSPEEIRYLKKIVVKDLEK